MHKVYVIRNGSGRIIYVGVTSNPDRRLYQHKMRFGKNCTMEVLYQDDNRFACYAKEKEFIGIFSEDGKLFNRVSYPGNVKKIITLYIEQSIIDGLGGKDAVKRIAEQAIIKAASQVIKKDKNIL